MEKHMAHLQQLKDFDEILALEREEKARQEQERRRIEVKRVVVVVALVVAGSFSLKIISSFIDVILFNVPTP